MVLVSNKSQQRRRDGGVGVVNEALSVSRYISLMKLLEHLT